MRRNVTAVIAAVFIASAGPMAALGQDALPEAPGELIDVGGHSLHVYCIGEGSPTVVFEAGLGDGSINFRALQNRLSHLTRACAYDRAGYGWSEPGPAPRDLNTIVTELDAALSGAGEEGPYVLAGHSFGGLVSLGYAQQYPDDVVGVVLIDSSHPRQMVELRAVPALLDVQDMEIAGLAGIIDMAEEGTFPADLVRPNAPSVLSSELQDQWAQLFVQPKQLRAAVAEYDALAPSLEQAGGSFDLGDTPVIVLSRGIGIEGQLPAESLVPLGLTDEVLGRAEEIWTALQLDLLNVSTDSKRVVAERSPHYVYVAQPALVEAAVRELVREARQ